VELFNKVIEQDPSYARAYAGLADTYAILGAAGYDLLPVSEAMEKARGAALKAIEIDDTLSEAHSSLAFVTYSHDWNWHESEKEFQRALVLNPSNATAHQWYSEYLCDLSRWPQAIAEAEAAARLDPNSLIISENLARPYYYSRQLDKAIDYSKKTLALDPTFAISHLRLGRALAAKGSYKEAAAEFQRFSDLAGGSTLAIASLANVHARAGERAMALKLASELRALAAHKHVPAYQFAIVYLGMGDADESINWLEAAFQERDDFLLILKTEPLFDGLRADRRFQDLERRIGFEP
jgi:Tfp pilus assembly protein PilF